MDPEGIGMDPIEVASGDEVFEVTLYDNETAEAFSKLLPLDLDMRELNGNEKYADLPEPLPADPSVPSTIEAGDVMLYQGDVLVFFYETFSTSYSYTRIGRVEDIEGLENALGRGSVRVAFKAV